MNYAKRKGLEIINLSAEKDEPPYVMTKEKEKNIIKNSSWKQECNQFFSVEEIKLCR